MSEIKFKLVDGEPVCVGNDCPCADNDNPSAWEFDGVECTVDGCVVSKGSSCAPGLRQQRREREKEIERLEGKIRNEGYESSECPCEPCKKAESENAALREQIEEVRAAVEEMRLVIGIQGTWPKIREAFKRIRDAILNKKASG